MNIFEYAMKMEEDGRAYYLENAEKMTIPGLKRILLEMADDELKHYAIFRAMRNQEQVEYIESEKTTIIDTVKNVFEQLKNENKNIGDESDTIRIWEVARDVEKKAEEFYREKAAEVNDKHSKDILAKIADEEHRHWATIENVMQFLEAPKQWLEDAEWINKLDTF